MSDRNFKITISAVDQASPVLRNIGSAAEKTSSALDGFSAKGLQQLGKQADQAGDAMADLGKETLTVLKQIETNTAGAAKGIDRVGDAAESAGRKSQSFSDNLTKIGAGAGSAVSGLSYLGQMYVEQERQLDALGRQYGANADQIVAFTERIQDSTRYSNDAARESASIAATLANQYGMSVDQIEQILARSADLAQTSGFGLADASERVVAALRGEAEAAERLGLTLNDANVARYAAAQGIDNYSSGLDEAGRAAVRFDLFMEQSAFAAGAAGDAAETAAGQAQQFVNGMQDAAQSLGGFLGPGAEVASVLGSYALAAPLAGAGFGKMAAGAKTAATAIGGLRVAGLAVGALAGPVGLVAAALGVGVIAWQAWSNRGDEARAVAEATTTSIEGLDAALRRQANAGLDTTWAQSRRDTYTELLGLSGQYQAQMDLEAQRLNDGNWLNTSTPQQQAAVVLRRQQMEAMRDEFALTEDEISRLTPLIEQALTYTGDNAENVRNQVDLIFQNFSQTGNSEMFVRQMVGLVGHLEEVGVTAADAAADIETFGEMLIRTGNAASVFAAQLKLIDEAVDAGFAGSSIEGVLAYRQALQQLLETEVFNNPDLSDTERTVLSAHYTDLINEANDYINAAITEAAGATTSGFDSWFGATEEGGSRVAEAAAASGTAIAAAVEAAAAEEQAARDRHLEQVRTAYDEEISLHEARAASIAQLQDQARSQISPSGFDFGFLDGLDDMVAVDELMQDQADGITSAFGALASGGYTLLEMTEALAGSMGYVGSSSLSMAADVDAAGAALGRANSLIVTTTGNMLGLVEASAGLASDLFGGDPTDGVGPLVDLLEDGRYTLDEFNRAREAGLGLLEQERLATLAINEIRADQLPYLEEQATAYTGYLQQIAELGDEEQRRVLYMQDANNQALLLNTQTQLYQASIGQLDGDFVSTLILERASWDTEYAAILEEMGILERDPITQEYRVVMPDGESQTAVLRDLTTVLEDLAYWLASVGDSSEDTARKLGGLAGIDLSNLRKPMGGDGPSINDDPSLDGTDLGWYAAPPSLAAPDGWSNLDLDLPPVTLTFDGDQARADAAATMIDIASLAAEDVVATILGNNDDAMADGRETEDFYGGLDGTAALLFANGDNDDALNKLSLADAARAALDGTSAWINANARDNASGTLNKLSWLNGTTISTRYVDIVTRQFSSGVGGLFRSNGGTVPYDGYANGGIPAAANGYSAGSSGWVRMNEAGGEMVKLPGGSLVVPAPATRAAMDGMPLGGGDYHFHFSGPVSNEDDARRMLTTAMRTAIRESMAAYEGTY